MPLSFLKKRTDLKHAAKAAAEISFGESKLTGWLLHCLQKT
jgi:hypothetical protein